MASSVGELEPGLSVDNERLPRSMGMIIDDEMNMSPFGLGRAISLAKQLMPEDLSGRIRMYELGQVALTCGEEERIMSLAQDSLSKLMAPVVA